MFCLLAKVKRLIGTCTHYSLLRAQVHSWRTWGKVSQHSPGGGRGLGRAGPSWPPGHSHSLQSKEQGSSVFTWLTRVPSLLIRQCLQTVLQCQRHYEHKGCLGSSLSCTQCNCFGKQGSHIQALIYSILSITKELKWGGGGGSTEFSQACAKRVELHLNISCMAHTACQKWLRAGTQKIKWINVI